MAKKARSSKRSGSTNKGLNLNMDNVEVYEASGEFEVLPEGVYTVKVDTVEVGQSKQKKPKLSLRYEIIEGSYKKRKEFQDVSLVPEALFKLRSIMEACGLEIPKGEFTFDPEDLQGQELDIKIGHRVYEGKTQTNILAHAEAYSATGGGDDVEEELEGLDKDDLKAVAKEVGVSAKDLKKLKKSADIIEAILEEADEDDILDAIEDLEDEDDYEEDDYEEDEYEEDEEDEDDEEEDYSDMSLSELKALAKERDIPVKKGAKAKAIIKLLEEDDEEDDYEEDEEEDYSDLSTKELKALCKERDIKVKKSWDDEDLIEALEESDED